jgi:hypothetical protein
MIRVRVKNYGVTREMNLADALSPYYQSDSGISEEALYTSREVERIIGRLMAALVEKHVVTLDRAAEIVGSYDQMEIVG